MHWAQVVKSSLLDLTATLEQRMLVDTAREMLYLKGIRPSAKAISDLLASG